MNEKKRVEEEENGMRDAKANKVRKYIVQFGEQMKSADEPKANIIHTLE